VSKSFLSQSALSVNLDDSGQTLREQIDAVNECKEFRLQVQAHQSCPFSTSYLSKDRKIVRSVSRSVSQQ